MGSMGFGQGYFGQYASGGTAPAPGPYATADYLVIIPGDDCVVVMPSDEYTIVIPAEAGTVVT